MSARSLFVEENFAYACIPNTFNGAGYLYPFQDFTFQVWVKTCADGVIASNRYRPEKVNGVCSDTTDYGYWSLSIDANDTLIFEVGYHQRITDAPVVDAGFPFRTYLCRLQSQRKFPDGRGGKTYINDNRWHRIEATRKGYQLRLYVDGVLIKAESFEHVFRNGGWPVSDPATGALAPAPALSPAAPGAKAAPLYIGWDSHLSGGNPVHDHFIGCIDEARLYGKALSRAAATQAANFVPPVDAPALLARFPFDADTSAPLDATGRNPGCTWVFGKPTFTEAGFVPPTPMYLRLAGEGCGAAFEDLEMYRFDGDFSVQAWVRPEVGFTGPLVSRQKDNVGGWTVLVEDNGAVTFYLRGKNHEYAVTSPPAALYDGNWHHVTAVREGNVLRLYVDGEPAGEQTFSSIEAMNMAVGGLYLGTNAYSGRYAHKSAQYTRHLAGEFDEVRLWSRALTRGENSAGMFHAADTTDKTLVGYWPFDDGTLKDRGRGNNNSRPMATGASFSDAPFDFTPVGQPYLLTQSCLMQEFSEAHEGVDDTTTYRVVVSARAGNDGARPSKLRVWSQAPVTIQYGKESANLDLTQFVDVETNAQGAFVFSIRAKGSETDDEKNTLHCPGVFVSADFMTDGEHILVSPDRQFHARLASVKGSTLQSGINGGPALLPAGDFNSAEADAIAGAINDIMTTAAHHSVQATGTIDTSRMKAAQARDCVALQAGLPTQPLYLSRKAQVLSAREDNHLVRAHYVPAMVGVERTAVSAYRASVATRFDYSSRTFGVITSKEVAERTAKCAMAKGDSSSWWSDFVRGALHVVESIVETVVSAANTLRATIVHVVDKIQYAFTYVIRTVADAADYLKGMLKTLGIASSRVIDFCRAVFSWEQYRPTCDLLLTYTDQMYRAIQAGFGGVNRLIDDKLMSWKRDVDEALQKFVDDPAWSDMTLQEGGGQGLVQPAGDVQSGYLGSVLCDHMDAYSTASPNGVAAPASLTAKNPANNDQFMAFLNILNDGRGVLNMGIGELVRGLQRVTDWLFNTAMSMVDGLFSAVEGALDSLWRMLDTPMPNIPILSKLFETRLGMQLTPRVLFCMMGAVASNLAYKVAKRDSKAVLCNANFARAAKDDGIFFNAMLGLYRRLGIPVPPEFEASAKKTEPSELERAFRITSYALSGTYSAATVVWGVTAFLSDLGNYRAGLTALDKRPVDASSLPTFDTMRIGVALIANLMAFPISCFVTPDDPRSYCDLSLFVVYFAAFMVDVVGYGAMPGGLGSMVASLCSGLAGALALAGSIVRLVGDAILEHAGSAADKTMIAMLFVQNVLGSLTLISQFCYAVPVTVPGGQYIYAAPLVIDPVAYGGNALLNATRLVYDVTNELIDIVR